MTYRCKKFDLVFAIIVVHLLTITLCANNNPAGNAKPKTIIAKVAGKEITLDDFISRSEYTIRPAYCKGDLMQDKKIILNSLIAEKLLAFETNVDSILAQNKMYSDMITGLQEQKMRELLSYREGVMKVTLDTNEIKQVFSLAGRAYKIQYFTISNGNLAKKLYQTFKGQDSSFVHIFNSYAGPDSIPEKTVAWSDPETKIIHQALFSNKLKKNQLIGPLKINDTTNLFINIKGWDDKVVITGNDITQRWADVKEKLTRYKADSCYDNYILRVMADKKIKFNPDVFIKIANLLAPSYLNVKKESENEFLKLSYNKENEVPDLSVPAKSFEEIKDKMLFSIDGKDWSVSDFKKEVDKHPLVFRKENSNDKFVERLKLAIVDLIRDKYLTDIAYKRGYDKDEEVVHYKDLWLGAGIAFLQRQTYLSKSDISGKKEIEIIENYLTPYIRDLLRKYSSQIEINVEEFDKIKLTRIDMFATQGQVPYPIYVPAFPQLTNYNKLDYGKKMMTGTSGAERGKTDIK